MSEHLTLLLDATGTKSVIAVAQGPELLAESVIAHRRTCSEIHLPMAEALLTALNLKPAALQAVAVTLGPGYFTGQRVTIATATTLASTLGIPLVGLHSLEILAEGLEGLVGPGEPVLTLLDGKKGELFWGLYCLDGGRAQNVLPPVSTTPEALVAAIAGHSPGWLVGEGLAWAGKGLPVSLPSWRVAPKERWSPRPWALANRAAAALAAGRTIDPLRVEPIYLRSIDAEFPGLAGMTIPGGTGAA